MDKYTVQDLINYSYNQQPIEFGHAFDDLITDRIASAVDAKKIELSQMMFTGPEPENDEWDDEETDSEEE